MSQEKASGEGCLAVPAIILALALLWQTLRISDNVALIAEHVADCLSCSME